MKYRVVTLPSAELDITLAAGYARGWVVGVQQAIDSLGQFPNRCRLARTRAFSGEAVRQLLYGRRNHQHRILSRIRGDVVEVLSVRHAARRESRR